jgi:hypothetical protein
MHLPLVPQGFPELAENFFAAPFKISSVRNYLVTGGRYVDALSAVPRAFEVREVPSREDGTFTHVKVRGG